MTDLLGGEQVVTSNLDTSWQPEVLQKKYERDTLIECAGLGLTAIAANSPQLIENN